MESVTMTVTVTRCVGLKATISLNHGQRAGKWDLNKLEQ